MKILITNTVALNTGVAAMVLALRDMLLRLYGPDAQIIVYEQQPEAASRYFPSLTFRHLMHARLVGTHRRGRVARLLARLNVARFRLAVRLRASGWKSLSRLLLSRQDAIDLENYAGADLIVSTGGTYLVDHYDLSPRIFDFQVSLKLRRPLVLFTQSLGPFSRPTNCEQLRPIFDAARLILLRDESSEKNLNDLGVRNSSIHTCADSVFAFRPSPGRLEQRPSGVRRPRVAVSVRLWQHFKNHDCLEGMKNYVASLALAIVHLVRQYNAEVCLVSTCQGIPEYWSDDAAIADDVTRQLSEDVLASVTVDRAFRGPQEMIDYLVDYDFVIATRYHMAVFAMVAHVPALAIVYEFMTRAMYERMGLSDWTEDIEAMTGERLVSHIDRCMANLPEIRKRLPSLMAEQHASAWRAAELIRTAVDESTPVSRPMAVRKPVAKAKTGRAVAEAGAR